MIQLTHALHTRWFSACRKKKMREELKMKKDTQCARMGNRKTKTKKEKQLIIRRFH